MGGRRRCGRSTQSVAVKSARGKDGQKNHQPHVLHPHDTGPTLQEAAVGIDGPLQHGASIAGLAWQDILEVVGRDECDVLARCHIDRSFIVIVIVIVILIAILRSMFLAVAAGAGGMKQGREEERNIVRPGMMSKRSKSGSGVRVRVCALARTALLLR